MRCRPTKEPGEIGDGGVRTGAGASRLRVDFGILSFPADPTAGLERVLKFGFQELSPESTLESKLSWAEIVGSANP